MVHRLEVVQLLPHQTRSNDGDGQVTSFILNTDMKKITHICTRIDVDIAEKSLSFEYWIMNYLSAMSSTLKYNSPQITNLRIILDAS